MVQVKNPQDFGAAIVMAALGLGGLYFGRELDTGTFAQMGPGYLPMALSYGLLCFAAIVGLRSFATTGPPIEAIALRAIVLVLVSIILFAVLIERAGLALTVLAVTGVSAFASHEAKWKEIAALGVGLAIFSVVVFVYALRQPMPIFLAP